MHRSIGLFVFSIVAAFLLTFMLVPAQSASAANSFFNFDGYAVGTSAENVTAPGIQMSSQFSAGSWQVTQAEKFATLSGNVLSSPACNDNLIIKLDSYNYTISLRFAAWAGATGIRVQGFAGHPNSGTLVQTGIHQGTPNGISEGMVEGSVQVSMDGADHILISDADGCVAIDDVRLNDMPIIDLNPEILTRNPIIIPQPLPLPGPIVVEPIIVQPVVIRGN